MTTMCTTSAEQPNIVVEVRCFAVLTSKTPPGNRLELPACTTTGEAMRLLGMQPAEVNIIFVNGVHADTERELADGDRVAFVPAVGGG